MCLHCGRLLESYLRNRGRQRFCRADARKKADFLARDTL
jgi:hypothetical protein